MKNIAVCVLSEKKDARFRSCYKSTDGFACESVQTTETGLKYINWKLSQKCPAEKLDCIYAFVTDTAKECFVEMEKIFQDIQMIDLALSDEGSLKGALKSVSDMFSRIQADLNPNEEVAFHVDLTGGKRHASMLMLVLMQMLKFYRYNTETVVYTNFEKKEVEDAGDLMDMYELISGTQSFIEFGSVAEIKKYFENKEKSPELDNLLKCMEDVSEALKISSSYNSFDKVLQKLRDAKNYYERMLKESKNRDDREIFYSKLLPMINAEYGEILPVNQKSDLLGLIKWCLKKNFLQQAITFYAERLPEYMYENGIFELQQNLYDEVAIDKEDGMKYKSIASYCLVNFESRRFLKRNVVPTDSNVEIVSGLINAPQYSLVRLIIEGAKHNIDKFSIDSSPNLDKFRNFIYVLRELDKKAKIDKRQVVGDILQKSEYGFIKECFGNKPSNYSCDYKIYMLSRIDTEKCVSKAALKGLLGMPKNKISEEFGFDGKIKETSIVISSEVSDHLGPKKKQIKERLKGIKGLIDAKYLYVNIQEQDFIDIVANYLHCVYDFRNQANHGAMNYSGIKGNEEIRRSLLWTVEKLQSYNKG